MRVVAGRLGGRQFEAPYGHKTHPMSDKARGALFNVLGDVSGLTVLDAFAGSGALAIEAISRGAKAATAVEIDKNAHRTIAANAQSLGITQQLKCIKANVSSWSLTKPEAHFDLVFADPPYDDVQLSSIERLVMHVAAGGLLVLSWPGHDAPPPLEPLRLIKTSGLGDIQLLFYKQG